MSSDYSFLSTVSRQPLAVLGIETSCDETAAAIVTSEKKILSNQVLSQMEEHAPYGGVVPEIAARAHMEHLERLISAALAEAKLGFTDLDGIAVTAGPGLIGGVIVGVMTAKAIASVHNKQFLAVNHLEGHALTARLTDEVDFPYLLLLVSGGHCQFLVAEAVGKYTRLGGTVDDALGEAFDKTAKMLGLGYPGGPAVEMRAKKGNPKAFPLPAPMLGREGCDFSFSGLKTAVRQTAQKEAALSESFINDLCASFQAAAFACVADRLKNAIKLFKTQWPDGNTLVVAGGVAANQALKAKLETICGNENLKLVVPPPALCTDNAAMIAWAGIERLRLGLTDNLDFEPRARWSLDSEMKR